MVVVDAMIGQELGRIEQRVPMAKRSSSGLRGASSLHGATIVLDCPAQAKRPSDSDVIGFDVITTQLKVKPAIRQYTSS
jgi:hypothetical protein